MFISFGNLRLNDQKVNTWLQPFNHAHFRKQYFRTYWN